MHGPELLDCVFRHVTYMLNTDFCFCRFSKEKILQFMDEETAMQAEAKEIRETDEARNDVESFIYEMRDKLSSTTQYWNTRIRFCLFYCNTGVLWVLKCWRVRDLIFFVKCIDNVRWLGRHRSNLYQEAYVIRIQGWPSSRCFQDLIYFAIYIDLKKFKGAVSKVRLVAFKRGYFHFSTISV